MPDEPAGKRHPASHTQASAVGAALHPRRTPAADGMPLPDSAALLRGHSSVAINHRESVYRLQATRQGKLIPTK